MEGDLGDVVGVGGGWEGESGDGVDGAAKLPVWAGEDALGEYLGVYFPALDFALAAARDEDAARGVEGEGPGLAAVSDDGFDAVLGGEVEELDEGVLGGREEVGRWSCCCSFLLLLLSLSLSLRRGEEGQSGDLIAVSPQAEHADLADDVPDDDVCVL